jgi:dihydrofolate reductase
MAKVISTLFISADGVAEIDPGWHFPYFDENMGRAVGEDYGTADVLLIGRETYDSFAGAWPGREAVGGDDAPFARQLGDVRKVVVSRQRPEFSWRNSELIKGDLLDAVTSLKADAGIRGILIPGSISVVQQLLAAGLVDELRLLVHPVAARKSLLENSGCGRLGGGALAGEPAGHDDDHGPVDVGLVVGGQPLVVADGPAVAGDPR